MAIDEELKAAARQYLLGNYSESDFKAEVDRLKSGGDFVESRLNEGVQAYTGGELSEFARAILRHELGEM